MDQEGTAIRYIMSTHEKRNGMVVSNLTKKNCCLGWDYIPTIFSVLG